MNALARFLLLAYLFTALASLASPRHDTIEVRKSKPHMFVFAVAQDLIGAQVEVYAANGDLVMQETLCRKKMIIDFSDVKTGTYNIIVKKGALSETFKYEKR